MGFDSWGSTRVAMPSLPTTDDQQVAQVMAEQRSDSRSLPGGQRSRRSSSAGATLDGTTYSASGESSAQITDMPAGIYAVTARCLLTWSSGLTDPFNLKVVAEEGWTIVGAGAGSLAAGSTLDLDVTAPGFAVVADGASFTATAIVQGTDSAATSAVTITAVRLGDTS